ncbi:MAG: 3-dehydroquinate synthase [Bacteroidetes bacterium]|nr:MAG: 3-dehydroquinate synthase [Bacteroidota bacterium]
MEKIVINTPGSRSEICVGVNWESVTELLPEQGVVIITDDNVHRLYGDRFPRANSFTVPPGEQSKKLEVIEKLAEKLLEAGIDRTGFVLAIGGGVICDLAGFLASIYMRGIRCGYVSTSLLSQVDASTGGKNGVNLGGTKNILGNIRQPEFVICDQAMLLTLPDEEFLSGLAELIKTAIIGDIELFDLIEKNSKEILERDINLLSELVTRSVKFKASVVSEDEKENGIRRILNFGHTYGHAVELQKSVKHGFAVASGMELATEFSFEKGMVRTCEKERIINMLNKFGLLEKHNIPDDQIEKLIFHDKKKAGNNINFVFTEGIGKAAVNKITVDEVIDFYKRFRDKK